jgi:hypothetical protein
VDVLKPRWSSSTFLLYLGAFTILGAMTGAYTYLGSRYGDVAFVGWTLLMLAILLALALGFRVRGAWITGGLYAYLAVTAFGTFVGAVFEWWGWDAGGGDSAFDGWHWSSWLLILLVLAAAGTALERFRFPLFVLPIAILIWFLVTDVVSGGGSWSAVVTLGFGLLYLGFGVAMGRVRGFWMHVVSGVLVAGALLYWWRSSTAGWWAMAAVSVVFVFVGVAVRRSSWAVIGALGLWASATYFSFKWTIGNPLDVIGEGPPSSDRLWIPIVVAAVLGFLYVALGLIAARRSEPPQTTAVPAVPTTPLAAPGATVE